MAPDAQKVQVRVGKDFDMAKGDDGAWTVTTTPLVVGFHYYSLVVDGVTVADPATRTFFGSGWDNSGDRDSRGGGRRLLPRPRTCRTAR